MNDSCNQMMACITINERVCLKSNNQYYIFLFFPLYLLFADSYIIAASFSCLSVASLFYYNNYQKYVSKISQCFTHYHYSRPTAMCDESQQSYVWGYFSWCMHNTMQPCHCRI